jgi:serine/threonine-protein kinase HipA
MTLREAKILYKDRAAGKLEETASGGSRFTYSDDWEENIACCFPITRREHEWPQGLHPFFQHLAPEGWLREQQARVAHVVEEDDLGLLLRYGADCIGAVSVTPTEEVPNAPENAEAAASPGRTVSGIQKKLLVVQDHKTGAFHPAPARGLAPFIAKFNSDRIPTLVRNEALSLRWTAEVLGAREVAEFTLARVSVLDEVALVVTRFDRQNDGGKLRLEDCAQVLCKPRGQDYSGKYDAAYEDIADLIKKHSARPAIDLARFFRRVILFTLLGNCDAHLKNFSLLETPDGLRLSPAYDVLNTAVYDGFDQRLALSFNGTKVHLDEANAVLFRDFGKRIALPASAIDQILAELKRQVRKAAPLIEPPEAEAPDGFFHCFSEVVRNSCRRILEE